MDASHGEKAYKNHKHEIVLNSHQDAIGVYRIAPGLWRTSAEETEELEKQFPEVLKEMKDNEARRDEKEMGDE